MAQRYSSRKQERFFQPCRLRVVRWLVHHSRTSIHQRANEHYYLAIQNALTGQVERWYAWVAGEGTRWASDEEYRAAPHRGSVTTSGGMARLKRDRDEAVRLVNHDTLQDARDAAKAQAVALRLPFDLRGDVISEQTLREGPVRECLACGGKMRSHQPAICAQCAQDAGAGREARAERLPYRVTRDHLLPYRFDDAFHDEHAGSPGLFQALLDLTGAVDEGHWDDPRNTVRAPAGVLRYHAHACEGHLVRLTEQQAAAIGRLFEMLARWDARCYDRGVRDGSSILAQLAEGRLPFDDFAAQRGDEESGA